MKLKAGDKVRILNNPYGAKKPDSILKNALKREELEVGDIITIAQIKLGGIIYHLYDFSYNNHSQFLSIEDVEPVDAKCTCSFFTEQTIGCQCGKIL